MRVFLAFLLAIAPWAQGAWAATDVGIRSGEHEGFSRLVVEFRSPIKWKLGRIGAGYELRALEVPVRYNVARVFQRIPRNRIVDLEDRGDGRLFLSVTCDCHVRAFPVRETELVIDIVDGEARGDARQFEIALPAPTSMPLRAIPPAARAIAAPRPEPPPFAAGGPAGELLASSAATRRSPGNPPPLSDPKGDVLQMEQAILRQVSRAASQGLLSARLTMLETAAQAREQVPAPQEQKTESKSPRAAIVPSAPLDHLSVQTAADGARGRVQLGRAANDECPDASYFDIAAWGGGARG